MPRRLYWILIPLLSVALPLLFPAPILRALGVFRPRKTVAQRLDQFGQTARARWQPYFEQAGMPYPPERVGLIGIKSEQRLEIWAAGPGSGFRRVRDLPIRCLSGGPGPKLREGDRQVPEGRYRIVALNPNSRFHVSLKLDYPNAFDRSNAELDRREDPGTDIFIHGKQASAGCLAMGDEAAEDLFTLAADTGLPNIEVILAPVDFRAGHARPRLRTAPPWIDTLYADLRKALERFPISPRPPAHGNPRAAAGAPAPPAVSPGS